LSRAPAGLAGRRFELTPPRRASITTPAFYMAAARKAPDSSNAIIREMTVVNKLGIHARPSAMFVKTANRFHSEIFVEKDGERINGKSIMGLMMLAAGPGSTLRVEAVGADAAAALDEIQALLQAKFGEE
jgi:phosphocarrier protein HPr